MSEILTVYQPGDRFATIGRHGNATVWEVTETGHILNTAQKLWEPQQTRPATIHTGGTK